MLTPQTVPVHHYQTYNNFQLPTCSTQLWQSLSLNFDSIALTTGFLSELKYRFSHHLSTSTGIFLTGKFFVRFIIKDLETTTSSS